MKRIDIKLLIITLIVCLLPIALGLSFYDELPESVAIHFDINNNPDSFAPKTVFIFAIPIAMAALQTACCAVSDYFGGNGKKLAVFKWIIPFVTVSVYFITLIYALYGRLDIRKCAMLVVAITFVVAGNYLPKYYRMPFVNGIRCKNEKHEAHLNRICGYIFIICGILCAASVFAPPVVSVFVIAATVLSAVVLQIIGLYLGRSVK